MLADTLMKQHCNPCHSLPHALLPSIRLMLTLLFCCRIPTQTFSSVRTVLRISLNLSLHFWGVFYAAMPKLCENTAPCP